ncbi:MAG: DUF1800 domain-containing protein [Proteobacteria bacterium]|nr:DUF1800 domain-containing protein [Pseudomonadota bacterium]
MRMFKRMWATMAITLLLSSCGGSGGGNGGGEPPAPPTVAEPPAPPTVAEPPAPPTVAELKGASRLAAQATFGMDFAGIESIARQGHEDWIDSQFTVPVSDHLRIVADIVRRRDAGEFAAFEESDEYLIFARRLAWWHQTVTGDDALRQRVAFALSEIFVVSDSVDILIVHPDALSGYYDMLLSNAFGNFRALLRDVSLHPAMGIYLSHINNRRSDPINNIFPDENYAREVMQLFSIGLFELNIDGSLQLDIDGDPIPTYSNEEIREFAKIFTGFSYGGPGAFFGKDYSPNFSAPMQMFDAEHEPGNKTLLNGTVVPAGQTGMQDFDAAIDNLFNHPNVGPFIGKQLIQRLVTSNPSPAYIERVARAYNGDTTSIRGDMRAVIKAVLLDPEATAAPGTLADFGKLREPVVRYASILRQFGANSPDDFIAVVGHFLQYVGRQHPLSAPSVFNFFLPAHSPAGEIADAGLVAPEFQITTSNSIIGISNIIDFVILGDYVSDSPEGFEPVSLDYQEYEELAPNIAALVDRLDIVLTAGTLDPATRSAIQNVITDIDDMNIRARIAIYMLLLSSDYAVRR